MRRAADFFYIVLRQRHAPALQPFLQGGFGVFANGLHLRGDVHLGKQLEYDLLGHDAISWAWYVVTNGADSTLVFDPDRRGPLVVPVPASEVVDSTGAGDAFVAGFLHAWDCHDDPAAATAAGHAASEQVIAGPGADYWKADLRAES